MYLKPPSTGQSYPGDSSLECGIWRDGDGHHGDGHHGDGHHGDGHQVPKVYFSTKNGLFNRHCKSI